MAINAADTLDRFIGELPSFDWSDFQERSQENERLLREISSNKAAFVNLIRAVRNDDQRFGMCEKDEFRYKLVLHRADDRGFRLRLHVWRTGFADCVHAHRFSYTALLLNGGYQHTLWSTDQDVYPKGIEEYQEQMLPLSHPFVAKNVDVSRIRATVVASFEAGQAYSQDHTVLSSTITQPDTVSLFFRGPAERDYSIQWHTADEKIVWRGGSATVPADRQREVQMTGEDFDAVMARLEALDLI